MEQFLSTTRGLYILNYRFHNLKLLQIIGLILIVFHMHMITIPWWVVC